MGGRVVQPRRHAELTAPSDDDVLVTAEVGPYGEVVALWSAAADRSVLCGQGSGGARSASARGSHGVPARLTRHFPHREAVVPLTGLALTHCHVQPLPDDRFLVASARCPWRSTGVAPNAQVFDVSGRLVRAGVLGDGIGCLATTPSGQTWVGYFDEGVFGNHGWGDPGPDPIGTHGLARFDADLAHGWDFPDLRPFGPIYDCYALNVADETVWACYYPGFAVVRIAGGRVTGWTGTASGVRAVVTDGWRCALVGGYGADRDRVLVGELGYDGTLTGTRERRLAPPDGADPARCRWYGRGDTLHVLVGTTHHRVDLDQLSRG